MEQRLRLVQGGAPNPIEKRAVERHQLAVPGQIIWKDARGTTRMASVVTRDVSERGVSVECLQGPAIPLYRIVYFQVDSSVRTRADLPPVLRKSTVLSAIFRVGSCSQRTGTPTEYALRLLIEPDRKLKVASKAEWTPATDTKTA